MLGRLLQDLSIGHFVLLGDSQNTVETAHVKSIYFPFLSGVHGPCLAALKQRTDDAGMVH